MTVCPECGGSTHEYQSCRLRCDVCRYTFQDPKCSNYEVLEER